MMTINVGGIMQLRFLKVRESLNKERSPDLILPDILKGGIDGRKIYLVLKA
jgi:hypothetical protein